MPGAPASFDYIIVGAGSAGAALAARLTEEKDRKVLLLEAGGKDGSWLSRMPMGFLRALRNPALTWGYMSEPEPALGGRVLPVPRGRVWGGSSTINGMFYMRGHSLDFDTWRQMGCTGWGHADVLPYFRRMEASWRGSDAWHGASGPLSVVPIDAARLGHERLMQAAAAAGYPPTSDIHGEVEEGPSLGEVTIDRRGRRASTARAYLRPALERPNLTVASRALATRVLIERGRAVGLEYRRNGETRQAIAEREVILAGGAYNSPQLLMLSGIGPAEELAAHGIATRVDLPGVGRNLSEHPTVRLQFAATRPVTFLNELRLDRAVTSVARWWLTGGGPFASQINACNMALRTREGLAQPDIQVMCDPIRMDARLWLPGLGPHQEHLYSVAVALLHPASRGWVKLRSADPADKPRIFFNLFGDPDDLEVMRRGVRVARRIYRTPPQGELTGRETIPGDEDDSDEAIERFLRGATAVGQHPVGTCAMGIGAAAVVDPELRVRGVEALRVVDASIMPTVPGANTNAAAIMVGEKAADLILGRRLAPAAPHRAAAV